MFMKPGPDDFEARALPKSFVIELTKRCNNHCLYCYLAEGPSAQNSERDRSRTPASEEICQ